MSSSDKSSSQPNNINIDSADSPNSSDYPTNPDTLNYNYNIATYNPPREFDSNYEITNYDITNFPKTDYNKFNSDTTNYNTVPDIIYNAIDGNVSFKLPPYNFSMCQSPDMLYQVPRDPQFKDVDKYMCFNNYHKLLEITKEKDKWYAKDLSKSKLHVTWQGSQCKITTPEICNRNNLTENCEATCFISPNNSINIKFQNNIWRVPELEEKAGACTKTAISEDTAQNSYCQCNNVLERPILKTKALFDKNQSGKFWCSPIEKST
jgi:hypothetical protein